LSIPGMPPITVSATLVGIPQPQPIEAGHQHHHYQTASSPSASATLPVVSSFAHTPSSAATATVPSSTWSNPTQMNYTPTPAPPPPTIAPMGFPPAGGYYQPKPNVMTDPYHPQLQQHPHPPVQNISLFNPVANSTPTSTAPPQAQEAGNFIRMYDPSAHASIPAQPQSQSYF